MNRFIQRVMIAFGVTFALSVVAIFVYFVFWQAPGQRCEMHGSWWDGADRVCAKPIYLPDITHRPIGSPRLKPGETGPMMFPPPKGAAHP